MKENTYKEFPKTSIRICIDSYDDELMKGRICGIALADEISFSGIANLVVKVDDAFNRIGQPQPFQVLRSFQDGDSYQTYKGDPNCFFKSEEISQREGKLVTVDMIMLSRKRAEWQGIIKNTEGQVIGEFDTILECVKLFESIIMISEGYKYPL